jgi:hypothetical protein
MPSSPDAAVDRLFQLPLAEFTAARNALAKELGKDGGDIRALEKPNVPAWAVNQLYWHQRPVYKKLIAAADARRAAHAKKLAGKSADIAAVEAEHRDALRAAAEEIRTLLTEAGESVTSATMHAVNDTLSALPGNAPPGRLTRPLKLAGFEALAGLVPASAKMLRGLTPPPRETPPPRSRRDDEEPDARTIKREADAKKREQDARRKEIATIEKDLRVARADAKKAEAALATARKVLTREKDERQRLQDQLQFAMKKIDDASADVREREGELSRAAQEQSHLEAKLATLT